MIHLDTSALVAAADPAGTVLDRLEAVIAAGEPARISSIVLYEWLRGPRTAADLSMQSALFPDQDALPFGPAEARQAALYRQVLRARSREIDIAIAATAIVHDATLWTLNPQDFRDIPGLKLL